MQRTHTCTLVGVVGHVEPSVPKPGSIAVPNPSPSLLEPVPIAKVTHDGDVTSGDAEQQLSACMQCACCAAGG